MTKRVYEVKNIMAKTHIQIKLSSNAEYTFTSAEGCKKCCFLITYIFLNCGSNPLPFIYLPK